MNIGEALKEIRKAKKIKQAEISKATGISRTYVCQIESGEKNPSIEVLGKICEFIKVPLPVLLFVSGEEKDFETVLSKKQMAMVPGIQEFVKKLGGV